MKISNGKPESTSNQGQNLMSVALAVVLLISTFLNCRQCCVEPIARISLLDVRWLWMVTVEFVFFFGMRLLLSILLRLTGLRR